MLAPSLPRVDADGCADPHFPRISGEWVFHCSDTGEVDLATHVQSRTTTSLPAARTGTTAFDGALYTPGVGLRRPEAPEPTWTVPGVAADVTGRPGVSGADVLLAYTDHVEWMRPGSARLARVSARPVDGQPAAVGARLGVWVEKGADDLDLWGWTGQGDRIPIAVGPGDAWRPSGDGDWLAWVEPDAVALRGPDGATTRFAARTGFYGDLGQWGSVVCWEERGGCADGVDVRCSDGAVFGGPGDQTWPSRAGPHLLVRSGGVTRLATVGAAR